MRLSPETCRVKPLRRIKTQLLHLVGLISLLNSNKVHTLLSSVLGVINELQQGEPVTSPHNSRHTNCLFTPPRSVSTETKIRTFVSYVMTSIDYGRFGDIWQFHLQHCFPTTVAQILQVFGGNGGINIYIFENTTKISKCPSKYHAKFVRQLGKGVKCTLVQALR